MEKKLDSIVIGGHAIEISVWENAAYPHVLFFDALCCSKTRIENRMTHQGAHDHSDDQFAKDVDAHIQALTQEVAGRCRSAGLVSNFVKS